MTPTALPRLFVSIPEAAQILGISKSHAYEMVNEGVIPVQAFGHRKLVPLVALERMADEAAGVAS